MPLYQVDTGWVSGRSRIVHATPQEAAKFARRRSARRLARDNSLWPAARMDAKRAGGPFSGRVPRYSDRLEQLHADLLQSRWKLVYDLVMRYAGPSIRAEAKEVERFREIRGTLNREGVRIDSKAAKVLAGRMHSNVRLDSPSAAEVIQVVRSILDDLIAGDEEALGMIGREIDEDTTDATDRELSKLYNVPLATDLPARDIREWIAANKEIESILLHQGLDDLERTVDDVVMAVARGVPTLDLAREYQKRFDLTWSKASFIARDQTANLSSRIAQQRMEDLGVDEYQWSTSGDSRVRQAHANLDGKIFKWSEPPIADNRGRRGHPGEVWQCLPGDTDVSLCHLARVGYRRWFGGELTEIVTATGETLRSTPNHPILTRRGWVPAHLVEVGEDVFRATGNGKVKIADVFAEFWADGDAMTATCAPGAFHGDSSPSVVEIAKVDPGPPRPVSDDDGALLNAVALNREPGALRPAMVSAVRKVPFSGYVYNLETDSGWYVAAGLVVHNCRCVALPVLKKGAAERQRLLAEAEARKEAELVWMQASPTVRGEIPNQSQFSDWNAKRISEIRKGVRSSVGL